VKLTKVYKLPILIGINIKTIGFERLHHIHIGATGVWQRGQTGNVTISSWSAKCLHTGHFQTTPLLIDFPDAMLGTLTKPQGHRQDGDVISLVHFLQGKEGSPGGSFGGCFPNILTAMWLILSFFLFVSAGVFSR
jgi:hypothetical protein